MNSQVSIKRAARLTTYIRSQASCLFNRDLRVQGFTVYLLSISVNMIGKHYSKETTTFFMGKTFIVMGKICKPYR